MPSIIEKHDQLPLGSKPEITAYSTEINDGMHLLYGTSDTNRVTFIPGEYIALRISEPKDGDPPLGDGQAGERRKSLSAQVVN